MNFLRRFPIFHLSIKIFNHNIMSNDKDKTSEENKDTPKKVSPQCGKDILDQDDKNTLSKGYRKDSA